MPPTGAGFCLYLHVSKRNQDRLCYPLGCNLTVFPNPFSPSPALTEAGPHEAQINKGGGGRGTWKCKQGCARSSNRCIPHRGTLPSVLQLACKGLGHRKAPISHEWDSNSWVLGKNVEEEQNQSRDIQYWCLGRLNAGLTKGLQDRLWAYPGG